MKKSIILSFLAISTLSTNANSNIGLGFSLQSGDSNIIQVPINLSNDYLIEPFVAYRRYEESHAYTQKTTTYGIGAGIFKRYNSFENTDVIYGVKFAYSVMDNEFINTDSGVTSIHDYEGYIISPTLGFEYFFTPNISLGGRVAIDYSKYSGNVIDNSTKYDSNSLDTSTALSINYYFN